MPTDTAHVAVIGLGTVGGSVAAGLRKRGWHVSGTDTDSARVVAAMDLGVIETDDVEGAGMVVVATPVTEITECARRALTTGAVVTDVGSVKNAVVDAVGHPMFVGGHPMAGSERSGLDGVDANLFDGATWVLTPNGASNTEAVEQVSSMAEALGAKVLLLDAAEHDDMVATISHVPHLAASALMNGALDRARRHDALLTLIAGGFRDMTRIAAGQASMWADITLHNAPAVSAELERLEQGLAAFRRQIEAGDREGLEKDLRVAAEARRELPERARRPVSLAVMHIAIPDRPGALGQVLGTIGTNEVNVEDIEITHDPSADRGALHLTVAAEGAVAARAALDRLGFVVTVENL